MKEKVVNQLEPLTTLEKLTIVNFLYEHLGEYGDTRENIENAVDYTLDSNPKAGGFILQMIEDSNLVGLVVINRTGMQGYVPENLLVYLAVHKDFRDKGLAEKMMKRILQITNGDIALHIANNNPEIDLFQKLGFEKSYLEMRYYADKEKMNKTTTL